MKHLKRKACLFSLVILSVIFMVSFIWWITVIPENVPDYIGKQYEEIDYKSAVIANMKISDKNEWYDFIRSVNEGNDYAGYKVSLSKDLIFDDYESFEPIGSYIHPFKGEFDGGGHTISGYHIASAETDFIGMFGFAVNAYIHDLVLNNVLISTSAGFRTGGLVGVLYEGAVVDCSVAGYVSAENGTLGGIVGGNHGLIERCTANVEVVGDVGGAYGLGDYGDGGNCGKGGIAGNNKGMIQYCRNFCNCGVTGWNDGIIDKCMSNCKENTIGGIADYNSGSGRISLCYNLGTAEAGIAESSAVGGIIDSCVNIGKVRGRYQSDIVSLLGKEGINIDYTGYVRNCLYVNSSKNSVVRNKYTKSSSDNYRLHIWNAEEKEILELLLNENDYTGAYEYLINEEGKFRKKLFYILLSTVVLAGIYTVLWHVLYEKYQSKKQYLKASEIMMSEEFYAASELFWQIGNYKDSKQQSEESFATYMKMCEQKKEYIFGKVDGCMIRWDILNETSDRVLLISHEGLAVAAVDNSREDKTWKETSLYEQLNTYYKMLWFNDLEMQYIDGDLSLLNIQQFRIFYGDKENRICKPIATCKDKAILISDNGLWWIIGDEDRYSDKTPFITANGTVNELGNYNNSFGMMIRPIITLKRLEVK